MKALTTFRYTLIAISILLTTTVISSAQVVQTVPLYHLYSEQTGSNFYTIDSTRKSQAMGSGWASKGIAAYVLDRQAPQTQPLFVTVLTLMFGGGPGTVFSYTTSTQERDTWLNSPAIELPLGGGYTQDSKWRKDGTGIAGYVAPIQATGMVPLYRLYHPTNFVVLDPIFPKLNICGGLHCNDTFLTTQEKDRAFYIKNRGYSDSGIVGYVWPAPTSVSMQPPAPPKRTDRIDTSGKPVNVDVMLLNLGCTRTAVGEFSCSNLGAFNACKTYMKDGRAKGCTYTGNAANQSEMDKTLFGLGCKHLLGRTDEFICITAKSFNTCQSYVDQKWAKRCVMAKQ